MSPTTQRIVMVAGVAVFLVGSVGAIVWLRSRGVDGITPPAPQASSEQATSTSEVQYPKDTDGDRVPDEVEIEKGMNPNFYDSDGDGWGDGDELYETKTDPLVKDPPNPRMRESAQADASYQAETSTTIQNVPEPSPPSAPASPDPDSDGLTNLQEAQLGTDPNKADTDGDGFNDGQEVNAGYNPLGPGMKQ